MSILLAAVAQATPVATPVVKVVTHTVTVDTTSHLFQLAQIIKYVGLGAGVSIIHSVVNGRFGLPKALNKVLPLIYSVLVGLAIVVVNNSVNWADLYAVFLQVLAGATSVYALVTVVNAVSTPKESLPVVTNP